MMSGCTLFPKKKTGAEGDGPPLVHRDVSKIPNAIPRVEPFSRYGNPKTYKVFGKKYKVLSHNKGYQKKGTASWYGRKFHGRRTSSGEPYDMFAMTAAHKSLPLPTYAKVKNLTNGKEIIVKINDRGPFVGDRLIDLSYTAAKKLGVYDTGTAKVLVTAIDPKKYKKYHPKKAANVIASKASYQKPLYLQLGAFRDKNNAHKVATHAHAVENISDKSLIKVISPQKLSLSQLYKVKVGPLKTIEEAKQLKQDLAKLAILNAAIVYE
mgnify:CR=1 FL=1|tara:strand:- start:6240 stop:7037 length:798 start_codon:yes stop_codon:yes gene_type:complete